MPPLAFTTLAQVWYPFCAAVPGSEKSPVSDSEIPIVIGEPVGLAAAAEPPAELAGAAADELPPAGVLAAGAADVVVAAVDFGWFELQPATSNAPAASAAVETTGNRRL
ncbi:MAG: hypothetical protein ACRDV3_06970 [Acidothermaceae bacterium]